MKQLALTAVFGFAAVLAWRLIDTMSADALAMAVGMVLGMGAGIPAAALILIGRRRRVRSDALNAATGGSYSWHWNGTNESGEKAASGIYYIRLEQGERTSSDSGVLLR